MSNEAEGARQQANACVDLLQQPERAEHGAPRGDWTSDPEPALPAQARQVLGVQAHRVVLAFDEPFAHLVQVGQSEKLRGNPGHQESPILVHVPTVSGHSAAHQVALIRIQPALVV